MSAAHTAHCGRRGAGAGADARGPPRRARRARRRRLADAPARAMALHGPRAARDRGLRRSLRAPPADGQAIAAVRRLLDDAVVRRPVAATRAARRASASTVSARPTIAGIEVGDPEARWTELRTAVRETDLRQQYPLAALNTAF